MPANPDDVREWVRDYYGSVLEKTDDLATNACCAIGAPPAWIAGALANVHDDVTTRFYGCGFPIAEAIEGATVLDLGCGSGRDVYVVSQLVGPAGSVHGVDMTEPQLDLARSTLDWHMERFEYGKPNVTFHHGTIETLEDLPIAPGSVDVVISNCVFNLSPAKQRVLDGVFRLLKTGGEFYFSDVFVDRRLPEEISNDRILHAECLGGAPYHADFLEMARRAGFHDPRRVCTSPITIRSPEIERRVGAARFTSETVRLFKLEALDARCEDYGQVATYRGGIPGSEVLFALDDHHLFEAGRPERICGNTAAMLGQTRLGAWFRVEGDLRTHYGEFPCGATLAQRSRPETPGSETCC